MNDFSHTCHGLGVGGGRPACAGVYSMDRLTLLKREYHSNVFDRLKQDSPKAACSVSYVSAPIFPRRKQINAHTLLHFLHREMRRTLVDVNPRASTERMRGDIDHRFCTYSCTELQRVPFCCHFATYYNPKKIVPELNDQPTYIASITELVSSCAIAIRDWWVTAIIYCIHFKLISAAIILRAIIGHEITR